MCLCIYWKNNFFTITNKVDCTKVDTEFEKIIVSKVNEILKYLWKILDSQLLLVKKSIRKIERKL